MRRPRRFVASVNRPNLEYLVHDKKDCETVVEAMRSLLAGGPSTGIVYCSRIKDVAMLHDDLCRQLGPVVVMYHSRLTPANVSDKDTGKGTLTFSQAPPDVVQDVHILPLHTHLYPLEHHGSCMARGKWERESKQREKHTVDSNEPGQGNSMLWGVGSNQALPGWPTAE